MTQTKRRLFVDCQVFQHDTWNRGMGRYTLKLLEAMDKEPIELTLILNKNIPVDKSRLETITTACPSAAIHYLRLSEDPNKHGGWQGLHQTCQAELDKQLGSVLKPSDTYLITSNFSIRYCSTFPSLDCKKALIFYDITPYLHWDDYKHTPDFEPKKYFAQFKTVFAADQLWAISESAAEEAKYWLGIRDDKVKNIRGASIRNQNEKDNRPKTVATIKHFLLSPSADGPNKNNENMVRAFAEFNAKANNKYKLVITSSFSAQSKDMLSAISPDLIFSGHVSDGELGWLYEHCAALLFVSKTEGLGLPVLEAVGAGKKVICSNIKVFREISSSAFYLADPLSVQSIAKALEQALLEEKDWRAKQGQYDDIIQTFSWPMSAQTCLKLIEQPRSHANRKAPKDMTIWYADSDKFSPSRDTAEMVYSLYPALKFRAMRKFDYRYNFPSYLIDMGIAGHALDTVDTAHSKSIYLVDDSQESAQLLLRALEQPGRIITFFSQTHTPQEIEATIKDIFDGNINYKKFVKLLELAGNTFHTAPVFSARGQAKFIEEATAFADKLIKGE